MVNTKGVSVSRVDSIFFAWYPAVYPTHSMTTVCPGVGVAPSPTRRSAKRAPEGDCTKGTSPGPSDELLFEHSVHSVSATAGAAGTSIPAARGASAIDARCARREVLAVSDREAHVVVALREDAIGVFAGRDSTALDAARRRCAGAAHEAGATTGARISVFMIAAKGWVERGGCVRVRSCVGRWVKSTSMLTGLG
jgi:hypothetical protein